MCYLKAYKGQVFYAMVALRSAKITLAITFPFEFPFTHKESIQHSCRHKEKGL